jgi:hypothetical protein
LKELDALTRHLCRAGGGLYSFSPFDSEIVQMASGSRPSSNEMPDHGDAVARQRRLIDQVFGAGARIRLLDEAPSFGGPIFVVDLDDGPRHQRVLGALGRAPGLPPSADPRPMALSAMDLITPARLVFDCERLMSLAFALCHRPVKALLLGVGGASMWRFVRAHLPGCATTLVEKHEAITGIARRWFYVDQPVKIESGERFVAGVSERFDTILVDLYDAHGSAALDEDFWAHCLDALAPGGCLATNWPSPTDRVRSMADTQAAMASDRGDDCFFVTKRGQRDNIVQYVRTAEGLGLDTIAGAIERFAAEHQLCDGGSGVLEDHFLSFEFPVVGQ